METLDPHFIGSLAVSGGVAFAMVWLAQKANMLERRSLVRCPSCGVFTKRFERCSCSD
jgi:hypothetical protein